MQLQSILREAAHPMPESGQTRILYIDADATLRASFARTVSARGFRVDTVTRPKRALRLAHRFMYPVIVAELRLPGTDGMALISELRALQPDASFVLASADDSALFAPDPMLESIACRLRKPWDDVELGQLVDGAVELHRQRCLPPVRNSGEHWSVLLVEDDRAHAQLITYTLNHCGACGDVAHCARLTSALALLQAQTFDVVITDLDLPDAPGFDAVTRLRAAAPDAALIALSATDDPALRRTLLDLGSQDVLVKGRFDRDTLRVRLQQAIEGKREARAF
jgi:DNA-binding response OmpR family regulator